MLNFKKIKQNFFTALENDKNITNLRLLEKAKTTNVENKAKVSIKILPEYTNNTFLSLKFTCFRQCIGHYAQCFLKNSEFSKSVK